MSPQLHFLLNREVKLRTLVTVPAYGKRAGGEVLLNRHTANGYLNNGTADLPGIYANPQHESGQGEGSTGYDVNEV